MRPSRLLAVALIAVLGCVEALQRPGNDPPTSEIVSPSIDTVVQVGTSVQFTGRAADSDGVVARRVWRFGNGDSTTSGDDVSYSFNEPGEWAASFQAFDAEGLASVPDTVGITVIVPNASPTATILTPGRDTTVRAGDPVAFLGTGSDADGSIVDHRWRFGDAGDGTGADPGTRTFAVGDRWVLYLVEDDDGAVSDPDSVRVTAVAPASNQPPVATIDAPSRDTTITAGDAVAFAGTGADPDGGITAHVWIFGDGGGAAVEDPGNHVYVAAGSYWATYTVTDDSSAASAPDSVLITVEPIPNQPPTARIVRPSQDTTVTLGDAVRFVGSGADADGSVTAHAWDFGDGATATVRNPPPHQYGAAGSYWAVYRVVDNDGAMSVPDSVEVTVVPPANVAPVASIDAPAQDTTVTLGDAIAFRGTAADTDGTVASHTWTYGDNNGATVEDPPAHTYGAAGSYWVTYRVTDDDGAASVPDSVRVTVVTVPNEIPQATIVAPSRDTTVTLGDAVAFEGTASDPDGTVMSHAWEFGDGNTAAGQTPPPHGYAAPGSYWAIYQVTDDAGAASLPDSVRVTVEAPPNQPPTAMIETPGQDTTVTLGDAVVFSGLASDPDGTVAEHAWEFGDGATASVRAPLPHTYGAIGTYWAVYRATDDDGAQSAPDSVEVTVVAPPNQPPQATIVAPSQDTTVTLGNAVGFVGSAMDPDGSVTGHAWDFGDGTTASVQAPPPHTYGAIGTYWAVYRATDDDGAQSAPDSVEVTVVAPPNQPPQATIVAPSQDTTVTLGNAVGFVGSAMDPDGSVTGHAWDFGDGTTASVQAPPPHTYGAIGTYWAVYRATDDDGAQSAPDSVEVAVVAPPNQLPQATIVAPSQDTTVTLGDAVGFVGSAMDPDGTVTGHAWDFGDGTTASVQSPPLHTYGAIGTYWAVYRATDDDGAQSVPDTVEVTVVAPPNQLPQATIVAPSQDTTVTLGDAVTFLGSALDLDGTVTAHEWTFGDGNGASVEDPGAHTYAATGVYVVNYRVTDNDGALSTTASVTVTVQQGGGGPNYALRFYGNGVNDIDRVKIPIDDADGSAATPGPPVDVGATDFTLEFWMRGFANENNSPPNFCGSWTTGNMILDRDRFGLDRKFGLSMAGGIITFGLTGDGTGERIVCGTTRVDDGAWHHIAVTRARATGAIAVFIDGVREGFIANGPGGDVSFPDQASCFPPCPNSNHFLVLGAEKHDATPDAPSFSGWLDELRISTTIRYTLNFSPPTRRFVTDAQTVGLYHFDEGTGTIVNDESRAVGGPSNGFLRVGGNPTGPIWVMSDAPTGS